VKKVSGWTHKFLNLLFTEFVPSAKKVFSQKKKTRKGKQFLSLINAPRVIFLTPNVTSLCHSMDQGVTNNEERISM
jgi:hypothetical protein